jgi:hypothetical protein
MSAKLRHMMDEGCAPRARATDRSCSPHSIDSTRRSGHSQVEGLDWKVATHQHLSLRAQSSRFQWFSGHCCSCWRLHLNLPPAGLQKSFAEESTRPFDCPILKTEQLRRPPEPGPGHKQDSTLAEGLPLYRHPVDYHLRLGQRAGCSTPPRARKLRLKMRGDNIV